MDWPVLFAFDAPNSPATPFSILRRDLPVVFVVIPHAVSPLQSVRFHQPSQFPAKKVIKHRVFFGPRQILFQSDHRLCVNLRKQWQESQTVLASNIPLWQEPCVRSALASRCGTVAVVAQG